MCCDFIGDPGNRGYLQDTDEQLRATIIAAHRSGWQVATHAIGDRAVDLVLDSYEEAQRQYPRHDPRHRIEYCAVTSPQQVDRIVQAGVVPVPQGSLVREVGDSVLRSLGPEPSKWCNRVRSFLERDVSVPGNTDRPVVNGAPLNNVHALVTRRTLAGEILAPEECISVDDGRPVLCRRPHRTDMPGGPDAAPDLVDLWGTVVYDMRSGSDFGRVRVHQAERARCADTVGVLGL